MQRPPKVRACIAVTTVFDVPSGSGVLSRAFVKQKSPANQSLSTFSDYNYLLIRPAYSFTYHEKNMHPETEYLRYIAEEIAGRQLPDTICEPQADHRLLVEARRLEKAIVVTLRTIDNFIQRDTYHNDTLGKLVEICDLLFEAHNRISSDTKVLLDLMTAVRQILPGEISPLLRLSKAFVFIQKESIKNEWEFYSKILCDHEIDPKLIAIAAIPFQRFIQGKEKLFWGDYTWLKGYAAKLDAIDLENADCNSKTEALMSLLIGRDFNHDQFVIYCKKYITERTAAFATRLRKLEEYAICEKLLLEDTQIGLPSFDRHDNALSPRLLKWIKEETDAIKNAAAFDDAPHKVEFNWDSDTTSVFYKYLMDKGVTKKIDTKTYAKQIAATVSTVGKEAVQWETIHKRLYSKDEKYLAKIFEPLKAILEDLKFFLKK